MIKKIICTLSALALVLYLSACAEKSGKTDGTETPVTSALTTQTTHVMETTSASAVQTSQATTQAAASQSTVLPTTAATRHEFGALLLPYDTLFKSGEYTIIIKEVKTIGGEAVSCSTITTFHNGMKYIIVEEAYNSKTSMLIIDGALYSFNHPSSEIIITDADTRGITSTLYEGEPQFIETGKTKLYDIEYTYESYRTASGEEFDLLFSGTTLERKRVYNEVRKDYDVTTVEVIQDVDATLFIIPDGYEIKDYR